MASIKSALKNRQSYTNKNGVTIPYKDLVKMKRLNDMLNYYGKVLGTPTTDQRIRIGSLSPSYSGKIARVEVAIKTFEFIRLRGKKSRLKSKKALTKWQRSMNYYKGYLKRNIDKLTNGDVSLNFTEDAIKNFRANKEKINIIAIANYQTNLKQAIETKFGHLLNQEQLDALNNAVDGLDIYELHRLATDHPDLIDVLYEDPHSIIDRLGQFIDTIEMSTGRELVDYKTKIGMEQTILGIDDIEVPF